MTILSLDRRELERRVGKITLELEEKITSFGTPIEEVTDNVVSVEVFPNRPDLLSLENFSRAINQFLEKEELFSMKVEPPLKDYTVKVDKEVKKVRAHTVCAVIKGLKLSEDRIKQLVDVQEKIHNSLGRKRKKLALGVYPLDAIRLPLTFTAKKPAELKFIPLGETKEMTGNQILKNTSTGKEFAHLLDDKEVFPVFIDADGSILSMPPIINSEKTGRVTPTTKDVFIECSGDNLHYLHKALHIFLASMISMGGSVYAMKIKDAGGKDYVTPSMNYDELAFKITDLEKTLGISLTEKEIKKLFSRMGLGYENRKGVSTALIPPYRTDILHWIDLAEEVAIPYGYEHFVPIIPKISTIGEENYHERSKRILTSVLVGLGLQEVSSFHLTTKDNIRFMHHEFTNFIQVENSKTERDVLRMDLLTNLLEIFSQNSHASYPQKIFEIGKVFTHDKNTNTQTSVTESERLAVALSDESINFTIAKQILDYTFMMLDKSYTLEVVEDNNFITGRVGRIMVNGVDCGRIGEIAPRVLKNWGIKLPVVAFELNTDQLL